jgi:hypothetical protein
MFKMVLTAYYLTYAIKYDPAIGLLIKLTKIIHPFELYIKYYKNIIII